jgi:hypothetical protein
MNSRFCFQSSLTRAHILLVTLLAIAILGSFGGQVFADEPSFPYQAFVLRDGTLVRSGPGEAHYATDELKQGTPVEVWRHDPDGWCAIRPTPDSFSLIPAAAVDVLSADRCRVKQSGLQAWVGTRLGPVENPLWQVKLNADEELTIFGEVNWPSPEGSSLTWYQVSPPDGEFRWVNIRDLQVPDPRTRFDAAVKPTGQFEELEKSLDFGPQRPAPSRSASPKKDVIIDPFGDENEQEVVRMSSQPADQSGWRRARRPQRLAQTIPNESNSAGRMPSDNLAPDSSITPVQRNGSGGSWAALDRPAGRDIGPSANYGAASSPVSATPGSERLSTQLRQIDMYLSMEIVKPAGQWQLSKLTQRLNDAYSSAASDTERVQAQQMLAKIDRLRELQTNLTGRPALDEPRSADRSNPATIGNGIAANVEFGTTYDAYGWLSECVQDSGRAPSTYVLQDESGKIICQVTPAPGFNMNRYLKSKIGVIGQRGYNQKLSLNHVLVDRVVVLENQTSNWK